MTKRETVFGFTFYSAAIEQRNTECVYVHTPGHGTDVWTIVLHIHTHCTHALQKSLTYLQTAPPPVLSSHVSVFCDGTISTAQVSTVFCLLTVTDLWMWGLTPPPVTEALMSASGSSWPPMACCKCREVDASDLQILWCNSCQLPNHWQSVIGFKSQFAQTSFCCGALIRSTEYSLCLQNGLVQNGLYFSPFITCWWNCYNATMAPVWARSNVWATDERLGLSSGGKSSTVGSGWSLSVSFWTTKRFKSAAEPFGHLGWLFS